MGTCPSFPNTGLTNDAAASTAASDLTPTLIFMRSSFLFVSFGIPFTVGVFCRPRTNRYTRTLRDSVTSSLCGGQSALRTLGSDRYRQAAALLQHRECW